MKNFYVVPQGAYIGALWKRFYTASDGSKRIKFVGYIILGIFGNDVCGIEISVYKVQDPAKKPKWLEEDKDFYIVKSGRRNIGFLVKEFMKGRDKRHHEYYWGSISLGGVDIRVKVLKDKELEASPNKKSPDYRIELAKNIKVGILRLV